MRAGIPDLVARERTITLYLDKKAFRKALQLSGEDDIHVLLIGDLKEGLTYDLESKGMRSPAELVGRALPNIGAHSALSPVKHAVALVNKGRCTKCRCCVIRCDDGGRLAYVVDETGYATVDPAKCYGCGLCPDVCPVECIALVPR